MSAKEPEHRILSTFIEALRRRAQGFFYRVYRLRNAPEEAARLKTQVAEFERTAARKPSDAEFRDAALRAQGERDLEELAKRAQREKRAMGLAESDDAKEWGKDPRAGLAASSGETPRPMAKRRVH